MRAKVFPVLLLLVLVTLGALLSPMIEPVQAPPSFHFSLSNSGGIEVGLGGSGSNIITANFLSGTLQAVSLACTSGTSGTISCSFNPTSGTPQFSSTLTITTSSQTKVGRYNIVVTGTATGGATNTTSFIATVGLFSLFNSGNIEIGQGGSGSNMITATLTPGATPQPVNLACTGGTGGAISCSFTPPSGTPPFSSNLALTTSSGPNVGRYNITVTGTSSGGVTNTTSFIATVGLFSLSNSGDIETVQGGSGSNTIMVTLASGATPQSVSLACNGLPGSSSCMFTPMSGTPSFASTLTLTTSSNINPGRYNITVFGTSTASITNSTSFVLDVPLFSLSNSGDIETVQGGSGSNTIMVTLASGATPQSVSLSCNHPSMSSCSLMPQSSLPSFSSTLTISTSLSTPAGQYNITVTGTGGGVTNTTRFVLTVVPTFSLSNSGSIDLAQGGSASNTIIVALTPGATPQMVGLACNRPSGLSGSSCSLNPSSSTSPFSSTLAITTSSSTPLGVYIVTVTGTAGTTVLTTQFVLTVDFFSLSNLGDVNINILRGSAALANPAADTVTLTNFVTVTHLSGPTNYPVSVFCSAPSGVSCSFTPTPSLPTFTGNITLQIGQSAISGSYLVTVTATGGGGSAGQVTHTTQFILNLTVSFFGGGGETPHLQE